jgi:hypothetical protein
MGGQTPPHPDASLSFAETFFRSRYHDYENDIVSDQPIDFLFGVLLAANEKKTTKSCMRLCSCVLFGVFAANHSVSETYRVKQEHERNLLNVPAFSGSVL